MNENLLYADILANAAKCDNTLEEQAHVVAFVTSAYPHALGRINKPFNPLLGETYECDRRAESGWRSISEQVCCTCSHNDYAGLISFSNVGANLVK